MNPFEITRCFEVRHTLGQHPALARAANGDLLLVYSDFTDRMEGQTGFLIRSRDNGVTWMDPELILTPRWWKGATHATLGMTTLRSGRVLLPWEHGGNQKIDFASPNRFVCLYSDDDGRTWRGWNDHGLGLNQFSPYGKIIEMRDGTVLCPGWAVEKESKHPFNLLLKSTDAGETWSVVGGISNRPGDNETDITLLPDNRLLATIRTMGVLGSNDVRLFWVDQSISNDSGRTWSPPRRTNVIGQSFNAWLTEDGTLLGACRGIDGTGRLHASEITRDDVRHTEQRGYGIHLFISRDDGLTWTDPVTLPDPTGREYISWHEAGEPCFCNLPGGQVMVAYYSYDATILPEQDQQAVPAFVRGEMKRIPHAFNRRICACVLKKRS